MYYSCIPVFCHETMVTVDRVARGIEEDDDEESLASPVKAPNRAQSSKALVKTKPLVPRKSNKKGTSPRHDCHHM